MEERNQNYVRLLATIAGVQIPLDFVLAQDEIKELNTIIATLTPKEKRVVVERFGLEDGKFKTLKETGEIVGFSRQRVWQIATKALRKLRYRFGRCKVKERINEICVNVDTTTKDETKGYKKIEKKQQTLSKVPKEIIKKFPRTIDWSFVPKKMRMTPELVIQILGDTIEAREEANKLSERLRHPELWCAMAIDYGSRWGRRYGLYAPCGRRPQPGSKYCALHSDVTKHHVRVNEEIEDFNPRERVVCKEQVKAISTERLQFMSVVCPACGKRNNLVYNLEVGMPYYKQVVLECYFCNKKLLEMDIEVSNVKEYFRFAKEYKE